MKCEKKRKITQGKIVCISHFSFLISKILDRRLLSQPGYKNDVQGLQKLGMSLEDPDDSPLEKPPWIRRRNLRSRLLHVQITLLPRYYSEGGKKRYDLLFLSSDYFRYSSRPGEKAMSEHWWLQGCLHNKSAPEKEGEISKAKRVLSISHTM